MLHRDLEGRSIEQRLTIKGNQRRELVWALEELRMRRKTITHALRSLALLGMGRSLQAQGKTMQARAYFDDVLLKYPKTTAAELAEKLLKSLKR